MLSNVQKHVRARETHRAIRATEDELIKALGAYDSRRPPVPLLVPPVRFPLNRYKDRISMLAHERGLTWHLITLHVRKKWIARPRQDIMLIMHEEFPRLGFSELKRIFGFRCHTTVIHGIKAARKRRG